MEISTRSVPGQEDVRAEVKRVIGVYPGGEAGAGPTSIFLAGMHGNEPAGVIALERVLGDLERRRPAARGRIVGVRGNLAALDQGQRFIDFDLNRAFRYRLRDDDTPRLTVPIDESCAEHAELMEVLGLLREYVHRRDPNHETFVIDLHTFSSDGPPFVLFSDTLRNRALARCLPVPFLLGLAEQIRGTASDYLAAAGCVSAGFESGRHDDPRAIDLFESAIRLMLVRAGHVDAQVYDLETDRAALREATAGLPRFLDVQFRHGLEPNHEFRMRPGYPNFANVRAGDHVADDRDGPIHAERSGRILLPLNQRLGDDGYFIGREISGFWLALSAVLRRLHVDAIASVLPGVSRHPTEPHTLRVNTRVARFLAADIFHLLGFRRRGVEDGVILVSRRAHDLRRPRRILF